MPVIQAIANGLVSLVLAPTQANILCPGLTDLATVVDNSLDNN